MQLAYLLTGETRPYLLDKTHMLRGVIGPARPADPVRVGGGLHGGAPGKSPHAPVPSSCATPTRARAGNGAWASACRGTPTPCCA